MLFETIMFVVTIYKLYEKAADMQQAGGSSLFMVLWRDGVVYYVVSLQISRLGWY